MILKHIGPAVNRHLVGWRGGCRDTEAHQAVGGAGCDGPSVAPLLCLEATLSPSGCTLSSEELVSEKAPR